MKKNVIDKKIIKDYVEAMNTTRQPMNEIKNEIARNLSSGLIEFKNVLEEVSKNVKQNESSRYATIFLLFPFSNVLAILGIIIIPSDVTIVINNLTIF